MNTKNQRLHSPFQASLPSQPALFLLTMLIALAAFFLPSSYASAAEFCGDNFYVDETLPNGARWDMCWEHRQREGIILHHIFYTPKNGQRRMVLNHAAVAQIFVPYDDNGARYHDISDYGIGGRNMLDLQPDECVGGTRLRFSGKNVLCKQIEKRNFAYKSGSNSNVGHNLSLFSVSPVGAYYYIPTWRFFDDGSIEPWIGATGALQRFGGNQSRGWLLGDNRIGISHLHNFFWKLDFDLNKTQNNDVVEEINFPLVNGKRERTTTIFSSEASRKVNPDTMRRWRVRDKSVKNANNHTISYDIVLGDTGHQDIGPASEPFTHNDFYVTRQRNDEKFASHNPASRKNLADFVNGESIANNDIVIWAGVTFYHMPRSEDAPHMDAHWSHLQIIPRDWHASNPLGSAAAVNTPPSISTPANQTSQTGVAVNLTIQASDVDGDALSYTATGLPAGLSINDSTGVISGTASSAGNSTVIITVNDGQASSTAQFGWRVTTVNTNHPPQLSAPANQSGQVGDSISLAIQATDADSDALSYSATGLPSGLTINPSTGVINGSLAGIGNYTVNLKVSDASSNTTASFSWVVIAVPTSVVSNEVPNNRITINGQNNDWNGIRFFANDPDDVSGVNNQIDWLKAAVAHSAQNVFISYENRQNVDPANASGSYVTWGWQAFFDTDNNAATGLKVGNIGADYILEGSSIARYIGTGTSWAWENVRDAQLRYNGKIIEMSFPRASIGNPQSIRIIFKGNNAAFSGTSNDLYPDSGFFSYQFLGVGSVNTPPVANAQQVSVGSGASISVVLSATDVDNDPLSYVVTQQPAQGSLSGSAPNLVYTANTGYSGSDIFKFKVNDGSADSAVASVNVKVTAGQSSGAISNFVNSPIIIDGNPSEWGGLIRFTDDPDDASGLIDWQNVAFAHDNQSMYLLYTNRGNINASGGEGAYLAWGWQTYIDADKNSASGYQTGSIGADYVIEGNHILRYTGSGSNWSWEIVGQIQTKYNNKVVEASLARSLIGNPVSIRVVFLGNNEAYQGTDTDLYPDGQNNLQAALKYFDYDFAGGGSGSNTRPVAYTQTVSVTAGSSVNITLNATDPENDPLNYQIAANPLHGTLTGAAPNVVYKPDAAYVGQDHFTFNVSDGSSESATVTVTINVTGSQNGTISNLVSSIAIDGNAEEWGTLTAFASDPNDSSGANNVIDWQRVTLAHNANTLYLMYQNYGAINPDNNSGSHMNWGWQAYLDTDNNAATGYKVGNLGADYILEGKQLQHYTGDGSSWSWAATASATLKYNANTAEIGFARTAIGNPDKFRIVFLGNNIAYNGNATDNYPDNLAYFEYQLSGGSQASANRPEGQSQTVNVSRNSVQKFNLLAASDQDHDSLIYRIVSFPAHGKITGFNASGQNISYKPDNGFTGSDSFNYVVNDGTFDSSVNTVTFKVAVNGGGNPGTGSGGSSGGGGGSLPAEWLLLFSGLLLIRRAKKNRVVLFTKR